MGLISIKGVNELSTMKSLLGAVAILIGVGSYAGPAQAAYMSCEGCDSFQMREAAMYSGDGAHTVYDVAAGVIRHYQVWGWGESELEFGQEVNVIEAPATAAELASMQVLKDTALIYGAPMLMSIEIPVGEFRDAGAVFLGPNVTAYDIQSDVNIRAAIQSRIESRISTRDHFRNGMEQFVQAVSNIFGTSAAYNLNVVIVGDDNSRITFSKSSMFGSYTQTFGSGRFSNGQVIPAANSPDFAGVWTFTGGTSIDDFLGALLDIGASFDGITGDGGWVTVVCEWRPQESTLYCTRQL